MKIRTLKQAVKMVGRRVRYVKQGGRHGWEGVVTRCNTTRALVNYDNGVEQEYSTEALFHEGQGLDEFSNSYLMVLVDSLPTDHQETTPEEDEAFNDLDRRLHPEPEWFLADYGRKLERLGKLLQDPSTTIEELAGAGHDAGVIFRFSIQPEVEETTDA